MTRAIRVTHRGPVDLVAVRFRPGGARAFIDVPAGELVDDWVDADALWGPFAAELWERMAETGSTGRRVRLLEGALTARTGAAPDHVDPLVLRAAALLAGDGHRSPQAPEGPRRAPAVARVADRLGVSRRHLERRFRGDVGLSPAQLRRVGRLRRAAGLIAGSTDTLGQVAVRAGYHDQAHMGRDFRELAGVTPGGYRRELGRA
ncbi:MAG: helix-turn-helix transcriptional regulator [Gemmatimonadota bacterium]|jgi:AraC-like DNA-binding protein